MGGKCARCGSAERLEFDHVDPSTKAFGVSEMWGVSKERREAELAKCQLLCRSCHRQKTTDETRVRTHGTWSMYKRHGCRCDECRRHVNERQQTYRRGRSAALPGQRQRGRRPC